MFAIPGILGLVFFIYVRPQEFFEPLKAVPFLYVCFGLWLFGMLLDWRTGNWKPRTTPQLPFVVAFLLYASGTALARGPADAIDPIMGLAICVALYLGVAHGVQSFRALGAVAGAVLAVVLFVSFVGAEQGFSETGCVVIDQSDPNDTASGVPDGRPCTTPQSCYDGDAQPDAEYMCEKIGLFGTTSVGRGRVRYRGVLQDPNELALAAGIGLPLAFAVGSHRRRPLRRGVLLAITLLLVGLCAVLTGSRGGQLVFLAVLGVLFVKRFGVIGLAVGGVLSLPLLLLGGRSGAEALSSTAERADCWAEALQIWKAHPLFGVGLGRFGQYHYMTAHNSYLLSLAELGLPGMFLFGTIIYVSAKIPFEILRRYPANAHDVRAEGARIARPWALALLAAFAGLTVGIFFLSFAYHYVLWIYLGLSGALYSAVRAHDTNFKVRLNLLDFAIVLTGCAAVIGVVYLYTRMHNL
ncbi:MAG TPA: O-antigen ligase family protein [Polyangiaceae bacterium]